MEKSHTHTQNGSKRSPDLRYLPATNKIPTDTARRSIVTDHIGWFHAPCRPWTCTGMSFNGLFESKKNAIQIKEKKQAT